MASARKNSSSSLKNKKPLDFYLVRLSPPCRAVWLYMLQIRLNKDAQAMGLGWDLGCVLLLDPTTGDVEPAKPAFLAQNPHKEVPILVDGDVVIFEGQAILRYLASTYTNFGGFGTTLPQKMLTESLISWAGTALHRASGYNYAYPHYLERYRLPSDTANESLIELGIRNLTKHLETLESGYLKKTRFLNGDKLTIADSYVATVLKQTEWVGFSLAMWPKVMAWLRSVEEQPHWKEVHASHDMFIAELRSSNLLN